MPKTESTPSLPDVGGTVKSPAGEEISITREHPDVLRGLQPDYITRYGIVGPGEKPEGPAAPHVEGEGVKPSKN